MTRVTSQLRYWAGLSVILGVLLVAIATTFSLELLECAAEASRRETVSCAHWMGPVALATVASLTIGLAVVLLGRLVWSVTRQLKATRAMSTSLKRALRRPCLPLVIAARNEQIQRRVVEVDTPGVFAFCSGLLRPKIFVSRGLVERLNKPELMAVIAHESFHASRYDPLRIVVLRALDQFAWIVPVIGDVVGRLRLNAELEADRHAVTVAGRRALLAAISTVLDVDPPHHATGAVASFETLSIRINALLDADAAPTTAIPLGRVLVSAVSLSLVILGVIVSAAGITQSEHAGSIAELIRAVPV